ncbi:MAG TPA: hypothetical protein VN758_05080 [Solirubrobacterales bacterium]|nr:hypothetical protein [Solirubrobacterales bacterium]
MRWLRRSAILLVAVTGATAVLTFADPDPPQAKANVLCDIGVSPGGAVTGALGIGNPVGDACDAITNPVLGVAGHALNPLKDAAASIGKGVFDQITTWAADGAVWLLGEVVELTEKTTSPDLLSKGFLRQYQGMASIATVLALLMLVFAVLESLGRGDGGMFGRVFFINVPLAAIATSAAFVVVQLLIVTTDGFCEAIARSTANDTHTFFKGAVEALAATGGGAGAATGAATGGGAAGTVAGGAAGAVEVPLFVGFIAAIVAAFAAFLVWIELLMRDAAIYVVALFMPMAIAASIWPRWTSALRRTGELLIVVVFSKFVIVAIIALAASLLAHTGGKVEQVLAAGALLLLACFAPFVLFKLVPFAEGAVSSAYNRQGAGGVAVQAVHTASSVQMMRRSAHANWAGGAGGSSTGKGGGGSSGGGASKGRPGGSGGGGGGSAGGEAAGASGGAAGAAALPATVGVAGAKASKAGAERLAGTGTAQESASAGSSASGTESQSATASSGGDEGAPRPRADQAASGGKQGSSPSASSTPEPTEAAGGKAPGSGAKPPRPSGDVSAASKSGAAKGQP